MPTEKQKLGKTGETLVVKTCGCPRCKRSRTLKCLPTNFKCADVICDFCGYLAQVKTSSVSDVSKLPKRLTSAAWKPQKERMKAGFYFPLFLVLTSKQKKRDRANYYLPADLQDAAIFKSRKPLSAKAKRAGWQGYNYDLSKSHHRLIRIR